jgi:hypothetical protein
LQWSNLVTAQTAFLLHVIHIMPERWRYRKFFKTFCFLSWAKRACHHSVFMKQPSNCIAYSIITCFLWNVTFQMWHNIPT